MATAIAGMLVLNATQVAIIKVAQNAQPCDDCKKCWKMPKPSEYRNKYRKLFLCEDCLTIRNHKRGS
jgi:hypothetical protein